MPLSKNALYSLYCVVFMIGDIVANVTLSVRGASTLDRCCRYLDRFELASLYRLYSTYFLLYRIADTQNGELLLDAVNTPVVLHLLYCGPQSD